MTQSVFDTPLLSVEVADLLSRAKREMQETHALECAALHAAIVQLKRDNANMTELFRAAAAYAEVLSRATGAAGVA